MFIALPLTVEAKKRSLVITFQNLVGTCQAMFFSLCYRQLIFKIMSKHTKYTEHYMDTEFIEDKHTYKYVGRSIMSGKFMYETVI